MLRAERVQALASCPGAPVSRIVGSSFLLPVVLSGIMGSVSPPNGFLIMIRSQFKGF